MPAYCAAIIPGQETGREPIAPIRVAQGLGMSLLLARLRVRSMPASNQTPWERPNFSLPCLRPVEQGTTVGLGLPNAGG